MKCEIKEEDITELLSTSTGLGPSLLHFLKLAALQQSHYQLYGLPLSFYSLYPKVRKENYFHCIQLNKCFLLYTVVESLAGSECIVSTHPNAYLRPKARASEAWGALLSCMASEATPVRVIHFISINVTPLQGPAQWSVNTCLTAHASVLSGAVLSLLHILASFC